MSYKIIIVESSIGEAYGECYHTNSDISMFVKEFNSIKDMLENGPKHIFNEILADLKSKGWVNIDDIKDREDRVKALKEYFLVPNTNLYCNHKKIDDIDNIDSYDAWKLAKDECYIAQKISNDYLKGESKTAYKKARKEFLAGEKKKLADKKKKSKKEKQNKIEKAKKLLEKAGIKVTK